MDEFDQIEAEWMEQHPAQMSQGMQMQLFPLSMAQSQYPLAQVPPAEPLLQRRIAGLPVWGWGLGVVGAGVAYWFYSKSQDVTKNTGSTDDDEGGGSSGPPPGQAASRTQFCERLQPFLQKNGIASSTVVYRDADEAAKKLKQVSPLVTIHCKGVKVPLKELDKFAKREGLTATELGAGVVGFFPAGGKKGKAWEEYIDDLRDAGQKV